MLDAKAYLKAEKAKEREKAKAQKKKLAEEKKVIQSEKNAGKRTKRRESTDPIKIVQNAP